MSDRNSCTRPAAARWGARAALALAALLAVASQSHANPPMRLKLDGIPGPLDGAIDIESFTWGVANSCSFRTGTGLTCGNPSIGPLTLLREADVTSPRLTLAALTGKSIANGLLTVFAMDGVTVLQRIKLQNVVVSSMSASGSGGLPFEEIELLFSKVCWIVTDPGGNISTCWDVDRSKQQ
jgi:type VI secretion system secreted protein Hcp